MRIAGPDDRPPPQRGAGGQVGGQHKGEGNLTRNCKADSKAQMHDGYETFHSVVIIPEQVFLEKCDFLTMKHDFLVPMDSH